MIPHENRSVDSIFKTFIFFYIFYIFLSLQLFPLFIPAIPAVRHVSAPLLLLSMRDAMRTDDRLF